MNISEIRVKLVSESSERLRAFCSVTLNNEFVIRDLKIIDGTNGPFVAMPSRKLTDHCPNCHGKNNLRARFCNDCGATLNEERAPRDPDGRIKLYADIAHPITTSCRAEFQDRVIEAFERELELAQQPGYQGHQDSGEDSDYSEGGYEELVSELKETMKRQKHPEPSQQFAGAGSKSRPARFENAPAPRNSQPYVSHRIGEARGNKATTKGSGFGAGIV